MAFSVEYSLANQGKLWRNDTISFPKRSSFDGSHKWTRMSSENDFLPNTFHKAQNNYRNNDAADREELLECFNKKFSFKPPEFGWTLPLETDMFKEEKWKIDSFMELKEKLNEVKNKLNNYNLDDWHKHTRAMNKAGSLLWTVKKTIAPEFLTLAWLKFYEICSTYDFVCKQAQEEYYLNSVHLCEAPGAFITSLNHYLKLNHPDLKWDWNAITLNPYYEGNALSVMINDDRFILHTLDHWKFGEDGTGNLMSVNNMAHLVKEAENMGPVLMVTADGSIECQNNPGEQEVNVSHLIYCEVVCALHILAKGGNFVVKMFTMYEEQTICLMYLLACSFETVHVYKPATSKEGNSENFVICLNYSGPDVMKPWLRKLKANYEQPSDKAIFRLCDIPKEFCDQLYECAKKFKNHQVEVIERNIYLFESENNQQSVNRTKRLRFALAEEFIQRYNLRPLNTKEDEIVGEDKLKRTEIPNTDKKLEDGSLNDKIEREKMAPALKLKALYYDVLGLGIRWEYDEVIKWLEFPTYEVKFKVVVGKPVKTVLSSKFCSGRLLRIRNEIQRVAKENFPLIWSNGTDSKSDDVEPSSELSPKMTSVIQKTFSLADSRIRVLNYKDKLWNYLEGGQNKCCESNVFFDIMDEMEEKMWRGYSLIIQGYPILTQFTAGVIYLMGHLFEKVGFVRPSGRDTAVIFRGYRGTHHMMKNFVRELDSKMEKLDSDKNKSVLSLIPIGELVYGHNEFYSCLTSFNNICVTEQISDFIQQLGNSHS